MDTGIVEGSTISMFYDPMISKAGVTKLTVHIHMHVHIQMYMYTHLLRCINNHTCMYVIVTR